jgi:hypothetical protein
MEAKLNSASIAYLTIDFISYEIFALIAKVFCRGYAGPVRRVPVETGVDYMERNERAQRIRALAWQTLVALEVLIAQVRDPGVKVRLERQHARLRERLKTKRY